MAELVTVAHIRAYDGMTAPMMKMAGNAEAAGRRINSAFKTVGTAGSTGMSNAMGAGSVVAGAIGTMLMHKEYEYDKQLTRFKAITEINDDEMKRLNEQFLRTGDKTSVGLEELLEGAMKWKEAGGDLADYTKSLDNYARVARITGGKVAEVALESRSLMLAFGQDTGDAEAVKQMEEFLLVGSKNIKGGLHALNEIMKSAAPIAAKLSISKERIAAMASVGVSEGFQPGEVGRALKTTFMRLVAPPTDAMASMRFAGIDMMKLYGIDKDKLRDTSSLGEGLRGLGMPITKALQDELAAELAKADWSNGMGPVQDKITGAIADSLGMKKGASKDRGRVAKAVAQWFNTASSGLNLTELSKLKNLSLSALTPILGKDHAAKIIAILSQPGLIDKIEKQILKEAPGAIDRKAKIAFQGFSFELDNLKTSVDNFWGSLAASGIKGDAAYMFRGIGDTFKAARDINPEVFRAVGQGGVALAAYATLSMTLGNALKPLMAVGALFAGLGGIDSLSGMDRLDKNDLPQKTLFANSAPMMQFMEKASGMGSQLAVAFKDIGTGINDIGTGIKKMAGMEGEFNAVTTMLKTIGGAIDIVAASMRSLGAATKDAPMFAEWLKNSIKTGGNAGPLPEGELSKFAKTVEGKDDFDAIMRRQLGRPPLLPPDRARVDGMRAERGDGSVMSLAEVIASMNDGDRAKYETEKADAARKQIEAADALKAAAADLSRVSGSMMQLRSGEGPQMRGPAGTNYSGAQAPPNVTTNGQSYGLGRK